MKSLFSCRRRQCRTSLFWISLLIFPIVNAFVTSNEDPHPNDLFSEHLLLRPLPDGRLHAYFTFEEQGSIRDPSTLPVFHVIPRTLVHLTHASQAEEIQLAINAGRWDYTRWGKPPGDGMVGTGAELRARISGTEGWTSKDNSAIPPQTYLSWKRLTADLAGHFCASLDALDEKMVVIPFDAASSRNSTHLRAMLTSEAICTENLSTLLRLLPCKTSAGLASLVEPHRIFLSDFHGIGMHLLPGKGSEPWKVKIHVQAVFSPVLQAGGRAGRDWSLESIFGTKLHQACPLADQSSISVMAPPAAPDRNVEDKPEEDVEFHVWPIVMSHEESADIDEDDELDEYHKLLAKGRRFSSNLRKRGFFTFDSSSSTNLNVEMKWPKENGFVYPAIYTSPTLSASRIFSGHGQERGKIQVTLHNSDASRQHNVTYTDILPWYIRAYLHTLHVEAVEDEYDEESDNVVRYADDLSQPLLQSLHYTPSLPRSRPLHLQIGLRIPPQSTVVMSYEYDKAFLRYAEHPPDAHRGFDIAPATVTLDDGSKLYTEPALVEVAVPDFSMPYNVIIFTSTVIALCAGSILNNLIRKYTDVQVTNDSI